MAGTTLVRTTLTGVRPLGVRGEPLHTTHEQIRGVIRRRLGERHARLLAEPQPDDAGRRIDWYSDVDGAVTALASLPETARMQTLADIDTLVADIAALGAQLQQAPSADARITGRALELACRRPSDDYVFMIGEQPVVVCWGYEPEAAGALLPPAAPATSPAVAETVPLPTPLAPASAPPPATVVAAVSPFPWLGWLLASALAVVLTLITAHVLRRFLPESPTVTVVQLPPPPAPPAPPPPPDPRVGLQSALGEAQAESDRLRATLASLRDQFTAKRAACPPPEPPKPPPQPPQVVEKKPPPPPPKPRQEPILKLPPKATSDYSFLKGCWRGDSFRYTPRHAPGYHTYCFDEHGNGQLVFVWQSGTTCTAPARARFQGDTLQIADADTRCSDGSLWSQDRLLCRPDASGVAQCSGETNLPSPGGRRNPATSFTVRLHRR